MERRRFTAEFEVIPLVDPAKAKRYLARKKR